MGKVSPDQAREYIQSMFGQQSIKRILGQDTALIQDFYELLRNDNELRLLYECAQEVRAELLADEVIDIADTEINPIIARNRIDARKWYAAKMQPKKYGDRVDINVEHTVNITTALEDAKRRALPASYQRIESIPQLPTIIDVIQHGASDTKSDTLVKTGDAIENDLDDLLS